MAGEATSERSRRAVRAAVEVAAAAGLRCDDAVVLRDLSNLLVHLRPAPVVARVATATATVRTGDGWLAREVAVASHLAAAGAPVVAPSRELPPGPHRHDGLTLSFFEHVEELDGPLDARRAGADLRACHEALAGFAGELPRMGALREARALVERLVVESALSASDGALLRAAGAEAEGRVDGLGLPMQPVHGDAHLGNVIATARGPLWNDWEDTFVGPVGWDLGCLHASARAFGGDATAVAAAQAGYGDGPQEDALEAFVAARRFQATVWTVVVARERPEARRRATARVAFYRSWQPDGRV